MRAARDVNKASSVLPTCHKPDVNFLILPYASLRVLKSALQYCGASTGRQGVSGYLFQRRRRAIAPAGESGDMRQRVRVSRAEFQRIREAVVGAPPAEPTGDLSRRQVIWLLAQDLLGMRSRGYNEEAIAKFLGGQGLAISAGMLRSYLKEARAARRGTKAKPRERGSHEGTPVVTATSAAKVEQTPASPGGSADPQGTVTTTVRADSGETFGETRPDDSRADAPAPSGTSSLQSSTGSLGNSERVVGGPPETPAVASQAEIREMPESPAASDGATAQSPPAADTESAGDAVSTRRKTTPFRVKKDSTDF